jgi:methyl-accepting chemotaxis protein
VFSQTKIRNQLFWMIATIFVPFAIAVAVAIFGLDRTVDRFSNFVDQDQVELLAYTEMYAQGLQMGQALRNIQLDPENPKAYENFGKARQSFSSAFETARQLGADKSSESGQLNKIAELRAEQRKIQDSIVDLVKADDLQGARSMTNNQETPVWREIKQIIVDKIGKSRSRAAETKQQVVDASRLSLVIAAALAAFAFVAGLVFSIRIATAITRRLNEAVAVSAQIAAGDLNQPINPEGANEVGQLMASLNVMQLKLKNIVRAIQENSVALNDQVISFEATAATYAATKDEDKLTELLQIIKKLTRTANFFDKAVTRFKV